MQPIIIASEKLKLYKELCRLCEFVGYTGLNDPPKMVHRSTENAQCITLEEYNSK